MDYAVTAQQMKAVDQNTIKNIGIPSMVLMERAALAVAEAAEHMCAVPETMARTEWQRDASCRDADITYASCLSAIRSTIQKR